MDLKVKAIVASYDELDKQWKSLEAEEDAAWNRFKGLTTKQMLKATMDNLASPAAVQELWKNATPADKEDLENLDVHFDLKTGEISVQSDKKAPGGEEPLFEWKMDTNSGKIEETTRTGNKERSVEKEVHPDTLRPTDDFPKIDLQQTEKPIENAEEPETAESSTK